MSSKEHDVSDLMLQYTQGNKTLAAQVYDLEFVF